MAKQKAVYRIQRSDMSKSFRDRPTWKTAELKQKINKKENVILPRVVQIKCIKSEFYPFDKQLVEKLLAILPAEYIYGLKRVELRPRINEIGNPYALYRRREKTVILYSVPQEAWEFDRLKQGWQNYFKSRGANIVMGQGSLVKVVWSDIFDLIFVFYETFLHELGHHYQNQYKTKKKYPDTSKAEERFAELFSDSMCSSDDLLTAWKNSSHWKR